MMYDEFTEKTGIEIDYKTYEEIVEVVYRHLPTAVYGGCSNTDFCNWVKKNGGMKIVKAFYDMCRIYDQHEVIEAAFEDRKKELEETIAAKDRELDAKGRQIAVYENLVPHEILANEVAKLSRWELLDILASKEME